jgi:alkanesulfonate monooxygenase SsuD/methylene tetrahydromethanopterin reductase-like flavin-dependent oxidoreductase (luciferase family)
MFGIELPAVRERVDRFESALRVLRALFSDEARQPPRVTLEDRFYPLHEAVNEPPPVSRGGPPIYLGGQGPRGLRLAGRFADGWLLPGVNAGDSRYLGEKRDALMRELEAAGRDTSRFSVVGQVTVPHRGNSADSIEQAQRLVEAGATELILGVDTEAGPDGLRRLATEVGAPLRDRFG